MPKKLLPFVVIIIIKLHILDIKNLLRKKGKVSFFELFPVVTKEYVIATFLAILEMAKLGELVIIQDNTFDNIICEVANE